MNTIKTLFAAFLITGVLFALAVAALTRMNREGACARHERTVKVDFDYKEIR